MIEACTADFFTHLKGTNPTVGIVLLHGRGRGGPDQHVIGTLRYALRNRLGISTMAPLLPYLDPNANEHELNLTEPATLEVITGSIERLKDAGMTRIYLIGHSRGAWAVARYITTVKNPIVVGAVLIGAAYWVNLPNIEVPVLDVYGTAEPRRVLIGAERRRLQFSDQPIYRQVSIDGADHLMYGHEEQLINAIATWIGNLEKRK